MLCKEIKAIRYRLEAITIGEFNAPNINWSDLLGAQETESSSFLCAGYFCIVPVSVLCIYDIKIFFVSFWLNCGFIRSCDIQNNHKVWDQGSHYHVSQFKTMFNKTRGDIIVNWIELLNTFNVEVMWRFKYKTKYKTKKY